MAVDASGNVLLAGLVENPPDSPYDHRGDALIAKFDPAGALLWERTYGDGIRTQAPGP